jgi:hypothetical protein
LSFCPLFSWAYPEFIGYGYSTCLTCHYNGHGGGPLSDYGRALWSAEIASRSFVSNQQSDESVAESSGFLGKTEIPWWIRPAVKFRGLWNKSKLGQAISPTRFYYMQMDANVVLSGNPDGDYIFSYTQGYRPTNSMNPTYDYNRFIARDYFLRVKASESLWIYIGLMDKVFGLRNVDHTSYARTYQSLSQTDQSLGMVAHKIESTWELSGNIFVGNPDEDSRQKQKGGSLLFEFEPGEKKRVTASILSSKSETDAYALSALGYRMGLSKGSSLLFEYGLRRYDIKEMLPQPAESKTGSWLSMNSIILLMRGYHLHVGVERYSEEFKSSSPDLWKWNLGFLVFPVARFELRADLVNKRVISESGANDDAWSLQSQLRVSL